MDYLLYALVVFLVVAAIMFVVGGITGNVDPGQKKTDHLIAFALMGLVMAVLAVAFAILAAK